MSISEALSSADFQANYKESPKPQTLLRNAWDATHTYVGAEQDGVAAECRGEDSSAP